MNYCMQKLAVHVSFHYAKTPIAFYCSFVLFLSIRRAHLRPLNDALRCVKVNIRKPKSCLGWVFNYKLGCFSCASNFMTYTIMPTPRVETRHRFCPVSLSLSTWKIVLISWLDKAEIGQTLCGTAMTPYVR